MDYAKKVQQQAERQEALRQDVTKTSARYDEIILLRMLLLEVLEIVERDDDLPPSYDLHTESAVALRCVHANGARKGTAFRDAYRP